MSSSKEEEYEEIGVAPMDVVIEIMKRLPLKSLLKFMSVSKSWKSIIRSSPFIADYNHIHNIKPPYKFFVGYDSEVYVDNIFTDDHGNGNGFVQGLTLPEYLDFKFYMLIGYSQGLLGFRSYNVTSKDKVVVIWNPSIRKSVVIPVPERSRHLSISLGFTVCNATDPTIFSITYKSDCVAHWQGQLEIYTLSTGEWRTLSNAPPPCKSLDLRTTRVVMDGFIHWIVSDCTPDGKLLILSLDLTSEQFTKLCLPPTLALAAGPYRPRLILSKLRESLVVLERDERKDEIGVWMMMMEPGVQNSFTKLYTVKVPPALRPTQLLDVLGFTKDGQPIFQMHVDPYSPDPSEYKFLFYEPDSKCFKHIGISRNKYSCLAGSYMETLLLLDHPDSVSTV